MKNSSADTNSSNAKIAITGGGSGGHLNTAFAVIAELKESHPQMYANLVFIGGTRGMIGDPNPSIESKKVPATGVRFVGIRSGKFHRKLSLTTFKLLGGVFGGVIDSWKVLRAEKPDLIFSTGGYVTLPVVAVGWLLGIPSAIHEQTIVSGLANRWGAKFANKVLVTFPSSVKYFPAKKTVVTGNPLQKSRLKSELSDALAPDYRDFLLRASQGDKPFLFITGGGLGSHKLNQWCSNNLEALTRDYYVLIQTGENKVYSDFENLKAKIAQLPEEVRLRAFATTWFGEEIGYIYAHASVVVCRPGANTVLELLATNNRAVLVPIAWASGNEQQLNAEYFVQNQTGEIVAESEVATGLLPAIAEVVKREKKNSSKVIKTDALQHIISELFSLLK